MIPRLRDRSVVIAKGAAVDADERGRRERSERNERVERGERRESASLENLAPIAGILDVQRENHAFVRTHRLLARAQ